MTIKIEHFAEKKIINFYMPMLLLGENDFVITNKTCDLKNDLIGNIMRIDGVERCLICADLVSVKYSNELQDVRLLILSELDDFMNIPHTLTARNFEIADLEIIEALADAMIRPTLFRDQGDIDIISLNSGVLKIRFLGHCSGCPYAQNTLKNVVAKTLQRFMHKIKQIEMEES